jgi:hypothetical protein
MKPLPAALGAAAIIVFGGVIVCVAQPGTDHPQLRPPETFAQIAIRENAPWPYSMKRPRSSLIPAV